LTFTGRSTKKKNNKKKNKQTNKAKTNTKTNTFSFAEDFSPVKKGEDRELLTQNLQEKS